MWKYGISGVIDREKNLCITRYSGEYCFRTRIDENTIELVYLENGDDASASINTLIREKKYGL
ncbi:MAG: hypothetical protein GXY48_05550 [Methanomicrobiales archaeon]|nr:hypothetical protein [Methanomicrobiales archaeon]